MQGRHRRVLIATLFSFFCLRAAGEDAPPTSPVEVIISTEDQKLMVIRDGMWTHKFRVSTSKFGLGDSYGSYKTPIGKLRVCDKIGAGLTYGAVIKHRSATGEILPVNAPGRDPIVTRILWLEGMEPCNQNAKARGIYIHGTVEESKIGSAVSYGCIRMKSREVTELFEVIPVGTQVSIRTEKLPKLKRWEPAPVQIIAEAKPGHKSPGAKETALHPVTEKTEPERAKKPHHAGPIAGSSHAIAGSGHGVVPHRAAVELHRRNGSPSASVSNPSAAMRESILFADLPKDRN